MQRCLACDHTWAADGWKCPACGSRPQTRDGFTVFAPELLDADAGYDPDLFSIFARLETESFWFRARNRLITWGLERYFPRAGSMLEIGCGTGFVLAGLREAAPELRLGGSDMFTEGLDFARRRAPDAALHQVDARRLPWRGEWDVIGAFDVLEHVERDDEVLAELRAAVRPGGGILLTVPQHPRLWSAADDFAHHERRYTRAELVGKAERAGFDVLRVTSFVSLPLPAMALSRLRVRARAAAGYDLESELVPPFNAALERTLGLELALIRRGVSFPAGGSLFLAAARQD